MKAWVIDPPGTISVREAVEPPLAPGECRVAVQMASICRTDLELLRGYMAFSGIPGHEFVGRVVSGPERLLGRRVAGEINASCGKCPACQSGLGRHCAHRTVLGICRRSGAFAEYLTLPEQNLLTVPDAVSDEEAVFAEPVAAALEIFEQNFIPPGAKVLVIGDGKLGLLAAQVCAHMSARVTLLGHHEKKLALARRWGVQAVSTLDQNPAALPPEQKFPFVIECAGSPAALPLALAWTAPRGTLVLKSTCAPSEIPAIDWTRVVVDEIRICGSRCGPFAPALRLLAQGKLDVRALIDHRLPFTDAASAFELAARKGVLKVLVRIAAPA